MNERWTLETLHIHLVALIAALEARFQEALVTQKDQVNQALASADRAVTKAETAAEKRFESVNEFRNTLADQQRSLMPRQEVSVIIDALKSELDVMRSGLTKLEGRSSGISEGWGWAIGAIGLIAALIAIVMALKH